MLVRFNRDHVLPTGEIAREGTLATVPDDDAYRLVHSGAASPPLRVRAVCDCLIGDRHYAKGELVDVGLVADRLDSRGRLTDAGLNVPLDERCEPFSAVVPATAVDLFHGEVNLAVVPGRPIALPAVQAAELVAAGGRFATAEEAAGLDLGGRRPAEKAEPAEPTGRLFFRAPAVLASGRGVQQGCFADVPKPEADDLVGKGMAQRLVKVRVVGDCLIGDRNYAAGDVVEVPPGMAKDADRFAPVGVVAAVEAVVERVVEAVAPKRRAAKAD